MIVGEKDEEYLCDWWRIEGPHGEVVLIFEGEGRDLAERIDQMLHGRDA